MSTGSAPAKKSRRQLLAESEARVAARQVAGYVAPVLDEEPRLHAPHSGQRERALAALKIQREGLRVYSGDQVAIQATLLEYARMGDTATPYNILNRGKAKADSQLRKDLLGLVMPDAEDPRKTAAVPLPWVALHHATKEVMGCDNPERRLEQLYFLSRAYNTTCVELSFRLDRRTNGEVGMDDRLLRGPAANHVQAFCGAAAKSIRPEDFGQEDRLKPYRADLMARGPYMVLVASKLSHAFAAAHDGKITKGIENAYGNLRCRAEKLGLGA